MVMYRKSADAVVFERDRLREVRAVCEDDPGPALRRSECKYRL